MSKRIVWVLLIFLVLIGVGAGYTALGQALRTLDQGDKVYIDFLGFHGYVAQDNPVSRARQILFDNEQKRLERLRFDNEQQKRRERLRQR